MVEYRVVSGCVVRCGSCASGGDWAGRHDVVGECGGSSGHAVGVNSITCSGGGIDAVLWCW